MRANEIHLDRARLVLKESQTTSTLVVLRAIISATDDRAGKHEIIYSIQSITDLSGTRFLLIERLHDCAGDCLADPEPKPTDETPQRAWLFNSYNAASYIMGLEWLLASRGDSA